VVKAGGPLGLSIVGGVDHVSHPFGLDDPGVFVSKVKYFHTNLMSKIDMPFYYPKLILIHFNFLTLLVYINIYITREYLRVS